MYKEKKNSNYSTVFCSFRMERPTTNETVKCLNSFDKDQTKMLKQFSNNDNRSIFIVAGDNNQLSFCYAEFQMLINV